MSEGLALPQPSQALDNMPRVPVRLGLAPTSLEEGWRLANLMSASSLVPKAFIGKPHDVLVAIELGLEVGLAPMQSLQSIAVINGRPSLWGDGFLALIVSSPLCQDHEEYFEVDGKRQDDVDVKDLAKDTTAAVCTFTRRGKATPVTRRFSVGKAKKASLWTKEGPWQNYPDRMLLMRARSWAGRDTFPDLLRGIRTAEEAQDEPTSEIVTVRETPREPQRLSAPTEVKPEPPAQTAPAPPAPAAPAAEPISRDSAPRGSEHPPADVTHPPATGLSSKPAPPPTRSTVIGYVEDTKYVTKSNESYFEVTIRSGHLSQVYAVRDETTYQLASSFEGTDQAVRGEWEDATILNRVVKLLVGIAIHEGAAAPMPAAAEIFGRK